VALNYAHMLRRAPRSCSPIRCLRAGMIPGRAGLESHLARHRAVRDRWPSNGGGRLVGSLAGLPYGLAEAEQNFLVPSQTQALILGRPGTANDPERKNSALVECDSGSNALAGTARRYAECCLVSGRGSQRFAESALEILGSQAPLAGVPGCGQIARRAMSARPWRGNAVEMFVLARDMLARRKEVQDLVAGNTAARGGGPEEVTTKRFPRIRTPKAHAGNSYQPELSGLRTLPTLMGYSSRIMAESWESNTLYWAGPG